MIKLLDFFKPSKKEPSTNTKENKDKDAIYKKMASNIKWDIASPIEITNEDNSDFPLCELPPSLLDAASETSRFVKISHQATSIVSLSLVAVAIGKKAVIIERDGLRHFASLFFSIILASGERKSAVFSVLFTVITDWIESRKEPQELEKRKAKIKNKLVSKCLSEINNQLKDDGSNIDEVTLKLLAAEKNIVAIPPTPNLFTNNCTEERLFQLMDERNGCYSVMTSEGRNVFEALLGSHSKGDSNGDAIYLAGISGDVITRDRVGGSDGPEQRIITKPCLNVCAMIQPDLFNKVLANEGLKSSGAIARIWPIQPPSFVGSREEEENEEDLNISHLQNLNDTINLLLDSSTTYDKSEPHIARLSTESTEARRLFSNSIESSMKQGGKYADAKDVACKAVSQTCKLALVLHIAKKPEVIKEKESEVDIETWNSAEKLGTWFLNSALSFRTIAKQNSLLFDTCNILKWINLSWRSYGINYRQLMQLGPSPRFTTERRASQVLGILEDHGFLKSIRNDSKTKQYIINPICFESIEQFIPEV